MRLTSFLHSDNFSGWAFILPYLIAFVPLLLWPFIQGFWMSLHEWNLLAVTFNPGAKEFIGLGNYIRLMGGDDIGWSLQPMWPFRLVVSALVVALYVRSVRRRAVGYSHHLMAGLTLFTTVILLGLTGDWYDTRFWIVVRNTLVFVAWVVPVTTIIALLLAIALNREGRWAATLRSVFFFSQILSVTVVTLIWQLVYGVRNGFIDLTPTF